MEKIRNSEPKSQDYCFTGECPKFGKTASVTVHYVGSMWRKSDLHKTYHKAGMKCSLLEGTKEAYFSPCMENCPFVPEKYL